jgi:hypothetical protein
MCDNTPDESGAMPETRRERKTPDCGDPESPLWEKMSG